MPPSRSVRTTRYLPALTLVAVACVGVIDVLTPADAGVGLLACVPVLLASFSNDRRAVWITGTGAVLAFGVVRLLAYGAGLPTWNAARAITLFCLVATATLALLLQTRRVAALTLRDSAISASEMNRLLMSLLAHDLRAPLLMADQGFHYVEESLSGGYPMDRALLSDVRARLQRSLRAIEMVLSVGRAEEESGADPGVMVRPVSLRDEIADEVASFAYEAHTRGKSLQVEMYGLSSDGFLINVPVLRQALAIPLDNAVRYALPGRVRVSARASAGRLEVSIEDDGPGLSAHRLGGGSSGSGLGLKLCTALLARAGGSLRVERDAADGTALVITLPIQISDATDPTDHPAPEQLAQLAVPP